MPQTEAWEKEYRNPKLVTGHAEPQNDVKRYLKYLKKELKMSKMQSPIEQMSVIDLGCGTGRNANYLAELGCNVAGLEISKTALKIAEIRAKELRVSVDYKQKSIGERYPYQDATFDLALDVTSSNSLNEAERKIYIEETHRVLKPGGHFFVRALCKDGDANVKALLKKSPGKEYDTYVNAEMGLIERVFSKEDFVKMYSEKFSILKLEKKSGYSHFGDRIYKRNYWLAYMKKDK